MTLLWLVATCVSSLMHANASSVLALNQQPLVLGDHDLVKRTNLNSENSQSAVQTHNSQPVQGSTHPHALPFDQHIDNLPLSIQDYLKDQMLTGNPTEKDLIKLMLVSKDMTDRILSTGDPSKVQSVIKLVAQLQMNFILSREESSGRKRDIYLPSKIYFVRQAIAKHGYTSKETPTDLSSLLNHVLKYSDLVDWTMDSKNRNTIFSISDFAQFIDSWGSVYQYTPRLATTVITVTTNHLPGLALDGYNTKETSARSLLRNLWKWACQSDAESATTLLLSRRHFDMEIGRLIFQSEIEKAASQQSFKSLRLFLQSGYFRQYHQLYVFQLFQQLVHRQSSLLYRMLAEYRPDSIVLLISKPGMTHIQLGQMLVAACSVGSLQVARAIQAHPTLAAQMAPATLDRALMLISETPRETLGQLLLLFTAKPWVLQISPFSWADFIDRLLSLHYTREAVDLLKMPVIWHRFLPKVLVQKLKHVEALDGQLYKSLLESGLSHRVHVPHHRR